MRRWEDAEEVPARSKGSDALAEEHELRGFELVGSTVTCAHVLDAGIIHDHPTGRHHA